MLHLRCGDDIIPKLREAGVPGDLATWADPLCEGPIRPWPDDAARRAERADWLAARYGQSEAAVRASLEEADAALARAATEDETVLWFEHDLFDQAILVFLLARLADLAPDRTSLICIGSHPDVPEFTGLGQLSAAQLAALLPTRAPVSPAQFATARQVWDALASGDPERIEVIAQGGAPELPFLADALRRWLAELPSTRNGLGMTESLAVHAIAAGAETPRHAFQAVHRFESRPWLGDAMFYAAIRGLASGPAPLLGPADGKLPAGLEPGFEGVRFELTAHGRAVLTGRADWFHLAQPSRWHGGILLEGSEPAWRWDERTERVVRRMDAGTH